MVKYRRNFSEEKLDLRMSFTNKIYLRTWIQLTYGCKQGRRHFIYGRPEEEKMTSDTSWNCSCLILSHHSYSNFLREHYWTASSAIP